MSFFEKMLWHKDCLDHVPVRGTEFKTAERIQVTTSQHMSVRVIQVTSLVIHQDMMARIRTMESFSLEMTNEFDKAPVEFLARAHSREYIRAVNNHAKRMESDAVAVLLRPWNQSQ